MGSSRLQSTIASCGQWRQRREIQLTGRYPPPLQGRTKAIFLNAKKAFDRVNHWTLAKKLLDRNVPLHIVKLFIWWYREQKFMVRWGNSLSITFRCSNEIRQRGQLSPMLYNVYTDDLNHHLQATGFGYYVGGAWVNSLSYADDMVLLAPTVTALQTLLEVCHVYAGSHDIVFNTTKTVCMLVQPKQSQGRYSTRVRLGIEERSFVQEFCYLGHVMTADCQDDKYIKNNSWGKML